MTFFKWSTTEANNATADSTINWAEGQAPSSVNNSARAMMVAAAKYRKDIGGVTTAGSSTAYTVTSNQVFDSLANMSGNVITFIPHTTSGAAPTLNVDGLGAKAINGSTAVAVGTGALLAGSPYTVVYVNASSEFILIGGLAVLGTTSFSTITVTGAAAFNGGITCDTDKFTVADATGNTAIAGTLAITGATTGSDITASGALSGATAGGAVVATQANMETGTATNLLVSVGRQKFHPGHPKAWVVFNGSGTPAPTASFNVTSITDNGTGDYTINLTTGFSGAEYAGVLGGGANGEATTVTAIVGPKDATGQTTFRLNNTSVNDPGRVSAVFCGDQA